jgi:hypothetical protein
MKRIILAVIIVIISCAYAYSKKFIKEGWVNASTFRVTGTGTIQPQHEGYDPTQRMILACEAAQIHAQAQMIEKLAHAGIANVKGTVNESSFKDGLKKKFSGTIRGGSIVYKDFDEKTNTCEIVYQIKEKNLKSKVMQYAKRARK